MIRHDDKTLLLGISDSGKDLYIKEQITNLTKLNKEIFIIDKNNNYEQLIRQISGESIFLSNKHNNIINPFDLYYDDFFEYEDLIRKTDFIFNLLETIMGKELTIVQKSKLDLIIRKLYQPYIEYLKENNMKIDRIKSPTFKEFYQLLIEVKDEYLKEVIYYTELFFIRYTKIFSEHTNINTNNNIIRYDISELEYYLQPLSILICIEDMFIRLKENHDKDLCTYLFIDDADIIFKNQFISLQFNDFSKRIRMLGGKIVLSIQNFSNIWDNYISRYIISNFSKIIIFRQEDKDLYNLSFLFGLENEQLEKIKNFGPEDYLEI